MNDKSVSIDASSALADRLLNAINQAGLMLMVSLGHRTGLFDAMSQLPPVSSHHIAEVAGLNERYVREWLAAMVTGGIVTYQAETNLYYLPVEHAAVLTRAAAPNNLASLAQWVAVLGAAEDRVADAFIHGKGVPYCAFHRFHEVMAEESQQTTVSALTQHILPLVHGMEEKLRSGIDVLDVGCGSGHAVMEMARMFPASRFVGLDFSTEAIQRAQSLASLNGIRNVTFRVCDVATLDSPKAFDLVTAFDSIHDQAAPAAVLRKIANALKPGGTFLMQDIDAASSLQHNLDHPMGTFLYTISCMHCMSVSLANHGAGLGAMWGRERALSMLKDAGFRTTRVERLSHDILNCYYITSA